ATRCSASRSNWPGSGRASAFATGRRPPLTPKSSTRCGKSSPAETAGLSNGPAGPQPGERTAAAKAGGMAVARPPATTAGGIARLAAAHGQVRRHRPGSRTAASVVELYAERVEIRLVVVYVHARAALEKRHHGVRHGRQQHFHADLDHVGRRHNLEKQRPRPLAAVGDGEKDERVDALADQAGRDGPQPQV